MEKAVEHRRNDDALDMKSNMQSMGERRSGETAKFIGRSSEEKTKVKLIHDQSRRTSRPVDRPKIKNLVSQLPEHLYIRNR